MPNLRLRAKENLSSFRRIAIGTWETTKDPQVYGALELPADAALRYLAEFRAATGKRATLSHLMAKAVAQMLHDMPDANVVLRWNRIYLREDIGVFFQVESTKDPVTGEVDLWEPRCSTATRSPWKRSSTSSRRGSARSRPARTRPSRARARPSRRSRCSG